jgi:Ca2+-binding RTX toxin-like protein
MANILGTAGNDVLVGDPLGVASNDVLNSSWFAGDDWMFGGSGNDTYNVNSVGDKVREFAGGGTDTVVSRIFSYTLGSNLENLRLDNTAGFITAFNGTGNSLNNSIIGNNNSNILSGLDGNDTLSGGSGNDTLNGGTGNDSLFGGTGNDTLNGDSGNDYLSGSTGNDTLNGGDGDDTIIGGAGKDTMSDGNGTDTYQYFATSESTAGINRDVILDFSRGFDKIDLSAIDANITLAGNQAFNFIGTAAFSGLAGEVRYVDTGANLVVQVDVQGDGNVIAEMEIQLNGLGAAGVLAATDFVL